jgi:transposase InsO family protein
LVRPRRFSEESIPVLVALGRSALPRFSKSALAAVALAIVCRHADDVASLAPPPRRSVAERLVRTTRAECLDWLLIVNRRQLERVLRVFADHYNNHRPHRSL